jgi:PAS domain S-box-containing protein
MVAAYRDSHDRAACGGGTGRPAPKNFDGVRKVQAVSAAFRNILLVVFLIFVFAVVQMLMLWHVCNAGMQTATSLEHGGLPALNALASLQEHLALYRLYSYEYLFAREDERAGKAKAAATMAAQIREELQEIKGLLPDEKGRRLASNLDGAVNDLDTEFQKVRDMVDTDFPAAMKEMDQNIPARSDNVAAAAAALKEYGYNFSSSQANAAFGSFGWIKNYASICGVANILVAFGSVLFVLLAARRSSGQLSETLARLDGRTNELQQANNALQKEVVEHLRAQETLRESEEKFSGAFEHAPIGVALVSDEGRWLKVNRSICEILGYSAAQLQARDFQEITYPEDLAASLENVRKLLAREVNSYQMEKRYIHAKGHTVAVLLNVSLVRDPAGNPLYFIAQVEDISARKRAEAELENAHHRLLALSRQAGMAEVATSVLHNVGNVLNSVNISASLVMDGLRLSQCGTLEKVAGMLEQNSANLAAFFTNDGKGKQLPGFIRLLSTTLVQEQETAVKELTALCKHIDHIKEIVSKQQSYAKIFGVSEVVEIVDLVEDSLTMNAGALARHDVDIIRDYHKVPPINIEKHKVLQILVNLIRNAKYACDDGAKPVKQVTVRVAMGDGCVRISVMDNGIGIPPENLTRIFNHGFTTRKTGHGFGLHNGSLTAKELRGSLTVHSEGPGNGATFTLELPITR